jgi:hypothetical protein
MVKRHRVILDTNVILAAMRSKHGASHRLLLTIGHPQWQSVITPALMYEYEEVARRPGNLPGMLPQDITNVLDLIYQRSHRQLVWFSWRPLSVDPVMTRFWRPLLRVVAILWYLSTNGISVRRGSLALKSSRPRTCSN